MLQAANDPETYRRLYSDFAEQNPLWQEIPSSIGQRLRLGRHLDLHPGAALLRQVRHGSRDVAKDIKNARPLAIFGDSVTTDHISPAGAIKPSSRPACTCRRRASPPEDFNSYGSRRGNDRIMMRGTFANVRIKNLMVPGVEGGVTVHQPDGEQMSIYDASHQATRRPACRCVIFAGQEYGTGSSPRLGRQGHEPAGRQGGDRAVVRAHPPLATWSAWAFCRCQFKEGDSAADAGPGRHRDVRPDRPGERHHAAHGRDAGDPPGQTATTQEVPLTLRIDTPIEVDYYLHGGILPYVLRQLIEQDTVRQTAELLNSMRPTSPIELAPGE